MDATRASDELSRLIEKRASKQEVLEDLWELSVAKDKARRRRELRAAWYRFYMNMCEAHARTSEYFEAKAQALLEPERGEDA